MLQKNTQYSFQLKTLPNSLHSLIKVVNSQDLRHSVAYLVFLDMLQLLKM
jgi:hypothetical protein